MAEQLKYIFISGSDEIAQGFTINSWHVSQSVNAFTGEEAYDITISGSLEITGSTSIVGSLNFIPQTAATLTDNLILVDQTTGNFTTGLKLDQATVLSASYALTSSYAELVQALTSNQNVGGISSGDIFQSGSSIEDLLRSLLIAYIEPTISNLIIRLNGANISTATRDVGNLFTCNTSSFSATIDNPNGNFPVTASVTASGADIGLQQIFLSNALTGTNVFPLGSTLTINRASSAGSVSFTVNTKSQTTVDTQSTSTSFSFLFRNFLAASSIIILNDATAQEVIDTGTITSQLKTNKSFTVTCTSANTNVNNFTYIIYPATYGDLISIIQDNSFQVLPAFTEIGDFNITNTFSATTLFKVYQSNQPGAFQPGATLTIS